MKYSSDTRRKLKIIAWTLLLNFVTVATGIDASVDYDVEGEGFHRTVRYHIDLGTFYQKNCYVALHLLPDPGLFVNIDELADLQRHGKTTACSVGEIDVELFAEKAQRQNITVCAPLRNADNILSLPIHQRYQLPRENGTYINIMLPDPVLLLGCKQRTEKIKAYGVSKIDLCQPCVDLALKWRRIPYKTNTENYICMVPVGNLSELEDVTIWTLVTVYSGTVVIFIALWYSRNDKREKIN